MVNAASIADALKDKVRTDFWDSKEIAENWPILRLEGAHIPREAEATKSALLGQRMTLSRGGQQ